MLHCGAYWAPWLTTCSHTHCYGAVCGYPMLQFEHILAGGHSYLIVIMRWVPAGVTGPHTWPAVLTLRCWPRVTRFDYNVWAHVAVPWRSHTLLGHHRFQKTGSSVSAHEQLEGWNWQPPACKAIVRCLGAILQTFPHCFILFVSGPHQALLRACSCLCSGITSGGIQETIWGTGVGPRLVVELICWTMWL